MCPPRTKPSTRSATLLAAGCYRVFADVASGALAARPELDRALDHLRIGDVLVVWRLDRLGATYDAG